MNLEQKKRVRARRGDRSLSACFGLFMAWCLLARPATAQTPTVLSVTNPAPTTLTPFDYGTASPYPSVITVSNISGTLQKVTVTLSGVTAHDPNTYEIEVAGPASAGVVVDLMYDAGFTGGNDAVSNLTLIFDDNAASTPPLTSRLTSGTYQPYDIDAGDNMPSATTNKLAGFIGTQLNGNWGLYVYDTGDDSPYPSVISNWSLNFYYIPPVAVQFSDPQFNSLGQFQALLSGPIGTPLVVEGSTDLLTWTPLATNAMATSPVLFTDTNSLVHYLFYRALDLSALPVEVEFSATQINSLGHFQATLSGPVGTNLVIQTSADLKTWTPLATNAVTNSPFIFIDTNSPGSYLFYRAATSP